MQVRFYLERNKSVGKEKAIWLYLREKGNGWYFNTGEKVLLEYWDNNTQRTNLRKVKDKIAKGSFNILNQLLNGYESQVHQIIRAVKIKNLNANFEAITDELNKFFKKEDISFFSAYDDFIGSKKKVVSKDAIQKYERTQSLLREFEKTTKYQLTFEKINHSFFDKFYPFLIDGGMINNSAYKTISFLKTFMIWANQRKLTDNIDYKHFKSKYEKNEVIFLTEDELMDLYNLDIKKERLQRVRDLFVFQCFTGVRYSDIQNISRENIKSSIWLVRTQKTRDLIEIPLSSYAIGVLAKYKDWSTPLPVISNQKMNKYIKELCEIAKINDPIKIVKYKGNKTEETTFKKYELIGTHTARRTFVSLSLQKGMRPEVVMAITGHTTYKMMQKYLKVADSTKRDEMDKTWGSPLRKLK